jgi:hypothetical protein
MQASDLFNTIHYRAKNLNVLPFSAIVLTFFQMLIILDVVADFFRRLKDGALTRPNVPTMTSTRTTTASMGVQPTASAMAANGISVFFYQWVGRADVRAMQPPARQRHTGKGRLQASKEDNLCARGEWRWGTCLPRAKVVWY